MACLIAYGMRKWNNLNIHQDETRKTNCGV